MSSSPHPHETLAGDGPRPLRATPTTGDQIGRYVVLAQVGEGGMGVVLAAYDPELGRKVAIKLLHARPEFADRGAQRRLQREAQALAQLSHPNVVAVHDVGEHDGRIFLAMEFVDGRTLRRWLSVAAPTLSEIVAVFTAAGRGLAAAHAKGLVHRDFKLDNAMIDDDGRVRVTDFGLVRAASDIRNEEGGASDSGVLDVLGPELTGHGTVLGTPAYMSPEQYERHEITAASDQFSFCVALHEALYGQRPFEGTTAPEWLLAAMEGRIREPPQGTRVPAWMRAVVVRGLAPRPEQRWSSMHDLLQALADDPTKRRRVWVAAGALAVMAGAGAVIWFVHRERLFAACDEDAAAIGRHWNDDRQQAIAAAFAATDVALPEKYWSRAGPRFDAYATTWSELRRETCVAGTVEHTIEASTLARARACLDDRAARFATVLERLDAPDRDLVYDAITIAAQLPLLTPCADARTLALQPEPTDVALPEQRAELSRVNGLLSVHDLDAALALAQKIVAEIETDAPLHARAKLELGRVHAARSEYADAVPLLEDAYHSASVAADDLVALEAALELAKWVEDRDGNVVATQLWVRQAETLVARLGLEDHFGVPMLWGLRGQLAMYRGDADVALEAVQRALEIRMRVHGADHPDIGGDTANLGVALWQAGRVAEARTQLERAVEIDERTYGPDHPEVAKSLTGLGAVLLESGDDEEALRAMRRALEIREAALGPEHHLVGSSLLNVSHAYHGTGDSAAALRAVDRALGISEKQLGPDHREVAGALDARGQFLESQRDFAGALASHERALRIREKIGDPAEIATSLINLSTVQLAIGRPADALHSAQRARALREDQVGAEHPDVATTRELAGLALAASGRHEEALAEYRVALPVLVTVFGAEHSRVQTLRTRIAESERASK